MKLFTDFIQSIQLKLYSSSKEFKKRNLPLDIGDVLSKASRVLVCLPDEPSDAQTAFGIVEKLSSTFPNWNVSIITSESNAAVFLQKSKYKVLAYSEDELGKSGKPKKNFMDKFLKGSFDVAIDMSIPFLFTNLVLTWLSNAQLRVGFHHENREALYNFLIRHKVDATFEYSYLSLIKYLQSFH